MTPSSPTRPTILLVDDELFSVRPFIYALRLQYEVVTCDSVPRALSLLREQTFDLVITDMAMPPLVEGEEYSYGDAGMEVVAAVRRLSKACPMIVCTAFAHQQMRRSLQGDRNMALVDKRMLNVESLLKIVDRLLKRVPSQPRSFIVHGHDREAVLDLKDFLQNRLRLPEAVVLSEQQSGGKTLIEKFEYYSSEIDIAFALLTPDDSGSARKNPQPPHARARQNVLFELGYFVAKLGRTSGRVILLHKGSIEVPSDLAGVIYIDISDGVAAAGEELRRELREWL